MIGELGTTGDEQGRGKGIEDVSKKSQHQAPTWVGAFWHFVGRLVESLEATVFNLKEVPPSGRIRNTGRPAFTEAGPGLGLTHGRRVGPWATDEGLISGITWRRWVRGSGKIC